MPYTYKDTSGNEHELFDTDKAEEMIDVTTGEPSGYRINGRMQNYPISKETYEAIIRIKK